MIWCWWYVLSFIYIIIDESAGADVCGRIFQCVHGTNGRSDSAPCRVNGSVSLVFDIIAESRWNGQAVIMLGTDPNIFPSEWTTTYHERRLLSIV